MTRRPRSRRREPRPLPGGGGGPWRGPRAARRLSLRGPAPGAPRVRGDRPYARRLAGAVARPAVAGHGTLRWVRGRGILDALDITGFRVQRDRVRRLCRPAWEQVFCRLRDDQLRAARRRPRPVIEPLNLGCRTRALSQASQSHAHRRIAQRSRPPATGAARNVPPQGPPAGPSDRSTVVGRSATTR
jgi:hypothetical protein